RGTLPSRLPVNDGGTPGLFARPSGIPDGIPLRAFWGASCARCARHVPRKALVSRALLVPGAGFEPATNGLQNRCSTTELTRQAVVFAAFLLITNLPPRPLGNATGKPSKVAVLILTCPVRTGQG